MSFAATELIEIDTEQKAYDLLSALLNDEIDAEGINIDFSSAKWAKFSLKLEGSEFDSSLPSSVLRTLTEYQNTLYRAAAYVRSNKLNGNALPDDVKEGLELNFKFSRGSSEVSADPVSAITEMVGKVTEGMGPRAKFILALGAMLTIFGYYTVPRYLDGKTEVKKAKIDALDHEDGRQHDLAMLRQMSQAQTDNQKILSKLFEQQPKLAEIQKEVDQARDDILRQSSRANKITIQGAQIDGSVARVMTEAKRRTSSEVTIRARFKVDAANDAAGAAFNCKLINVHTGEVITATMLDALMSAGTQATVFQAFETRTAVDLEIHARKAGTTISKAKIVSAQLVQKNEPAPDDGSFATK